MTEEKKEEKKKKKGGFWRGLLKIVSLGSIVYNKTDGFKGVKFKIPWG